MQTLLLKALMALAALLSSHRDAIATIAFFYKHRQDNATVARETSHDLYRMSQRIQAYIDNKGGALPFKEGHLVITIDQAKALRDACNDTRANLSQIENTPNLPHPAPYSGMLPKAYPGISGSPAHHEDVHQSAITTWHDIQTDLEGM